MTLAHFFCRKMQNNLHIPQKCSTFAADFNSDSLTMEDRQEQNSSGMMHIADLQQAVQVIKGAIQRSQARSLQHVNNEMLYF